MTVQEALPSQPGIARLHRIVGAVELAQISQAADDEAMIIRFAALEQCVDVVGHLDARLCACLRRAARQKIIGLHDAVDRRLRSTVPHAATPASARRPRWPCWRASACWPRRPGTAAR